MHNLKNYFSLLTCLMVSKPNVYIKKMNLQLKVSAVTLQPPCNILLVCFASVLFRIEMIKFAECGGVNQFYRMTHVSGASYCCAH